MKRSLYLYAGVCIFLLAWWTWAFQGNSNQASHAEEYLESKIEHHVSWLIPIKREDLHAALRGDEKLMMSLMASWEEEAKTLRNLKISGIQDFTDLEMITPYVKEVQDDSGKLFNVGLTPERILPQTYAAASVLLALIPPQRIVALPKGIREQTQIYDATVLNSIALDIDRYQSEKIYQARPELALISHYSHPGTTQVLKNQGISCFTLKDINSVKDVIEVISQIGNLVGSIEKAALMQKFINAALMAIDNQWRAILWVTKEDPDNLRVLYLNEYMSYLIPPKQSLIGDLLSRLKINKGIPVDHEIKRVSISQEMLSLVNPDCIIISAQAHTHKIRNKIKNAHALAHIEALKKGSIYFVDEAVQETPTQYIVLAYFDIFEVLKQHLLKNYE